MANNLFPTDEEYLDQFDDEGIEDTEEEPEEVEEVDDDEENEAEPDNKNSYMFDWSTGEFVIGHDGKIKQCDPLEAYLTWCNKALYTPRYKKSYPEYYGSELHELIASELDENAIELEIERIVKETLEVHPLTADIDNFEFNWETRACVYYSFDITTTDNEKINFKTSLEQEV